MRRRIIVVLLLIAAAAAAWLSFSLQHEPALVVSLEPEDARVSALPVREKLGGARGELFTPRAEPIAPAQPPSSQAAERASPPALPYRYAGKLVREGAPLILLAKGDAIFPISEGETLEDGYRVESISADRITLLYLPMGVRDTIAIDSMLPTDAVAAVAVTTERAQLYWEGPESAQEGSPFEVVLKLTSAQPVRSSPLQLSYDAQFLKPVRVRAGSYLRTGDFSYLLSPNGSILVAARGSGGTVSDAEFIVITFMPIRSGGTAELNLAAADLRGEADRVIGYDPPEPFRIVIE